MPPTKFQINWPYSSGEEAKNRFSRGGHGGHLEFPIGRILATFDLQITPMLPTVSSQLASWFRRRIKK